MIAITINETASKLLAKAWKGDVLRGLRDTMATENQLTVGHIRRARMTGKGPFPVSEGRLGVRTNRLRSSLRASRARVVGGRVVGSIGSNVVYAAAHEFGNAKTPARAPITRGIEDRRSAYETAFSNSIINTLRGLGYR